MKKQRKKKTAPPSRVRDRGFQPNDAVKRYDKMLKSGGITDDDLIFSSYWKKDKEVTHLVEAPWSYVIMFAFATGFLVALIRSFWYAHFGPPIDWKPIVLENNPAIVSYEAGAKR